MGELPFDGSHALVVGIDAYTGGIPQLRTAVHDAQAIAAVLGRHGFTNRDQGEPYLLCNDVATRARLLGVVREVWPRSVKSEDRVVVYFAGHGISVPSDEGPAGYLLLHDAALADERTFLSMRELHDALLALPCRHALVILDCCFAGTFRWAQARDFHMARAVSRERFERFCRSPAWQLVTSAASDQRAFDVLGDHGGGSMGGHSPFAAALLSALDGAADLNGDGLVTATELYLYVRDRVEVETEALSTVQTPGLFPLRRHEFGEFVFRVPGARLDLPDAPVLTAAANPYRGLASYEEKDADLFFGRDAVVDQLLAFVANHPLTVVSGASGTGKSSLVQAGLVHRLRQQAWTILGPYRPSRAPGASARQIAGAVATSEGPTLVVVDQLEELITYRTGVAVREAFLDTLAELARDSGTTRLVVVVRSDFESQLQTALLGSVWSEGRFVVPPMTQDELRAAILGPAEARDLYFKPSSLVDRLINEVVQTPGALPLLSFTLSELYGRCLTPDSRDRALTEDHYNALGGVTRALTRRANEELSAVTEIAPAYRDTVRRVMLRLVAASAGDIARRRAARSELVFKSDDENRRVEEIVRRFVAARLLIAGTEPRDGAYIEPAHDALVRGWTELQDWREQIADDWPLYRATAGAAVDWAAHRRDAGLLWSDDPRLPQLQGLAEQRSHVFNALELEFATASIDRRRSRRRRRGAAIGAVIVGLAMFTGVAFWLRDRANDEAERANRNLARERDTARTLAASALQDSDPSAAAALLREVDDPDATHRWYQQALDVANEPLTARDYDRLDVPIYETLVDPALDVALTGASGRVDVWSVGATTPIHTISGTGDVTLMRRLPEQRALVLWADSRADIVTLRAPFDARRFDLNVGDGSAGVVDAAMLQSGRALIVLYDTGLVRAFDPASLAPITEARIETDKTHGLVVPRAGDEFVVATKSALQRWSFDAAHLVPGATRPLPHYHALAQSSTLGSIAVATPKELLVIDADDFAKTETMPLVDPVTRCAAEGYALDPAFGPTRGVRPRRTLVETKGRAIHTHGISNGAGESLYFAPQERWLVYTKGNGAAVVTPGSESGWIMCGHRGSIRDVQFSPDAQRILTIGDDHTIRSFTTAGGPRGVYRGLGARVVGAGFLAGGKYVFGASEQGTVRLWNSRAALERMLVDQVATLGFDRDGILWTDATTISKDAVQAAFVGIDPRRDRPFLFGTAALPPNALGAIRPERRPLDAGLRLRIARSGGESEWGEVRALGSHYVVRTYRQGTGAPGTAYRIALWGTDGRVRKEWTVDASVTPEIVAASDAAGGDYALVAAGGSYMLVDAETATLTKLTSCTPASRRAAIARSGGRYALGGRDGKICLGQRSSSTMTILDDHRGAITALDFDASGQRLLSASDDLTFRIWDASGTTVYVGSRKRRILSATLSPSGDRVAVELDFDRPSVEIVELPSSGRLRQLFATTMRFCLPAHTRTELLQEPPDIGKLRDCQARYGGEPTDDLADLRPPDPTGPGIDGARHALDRYVKLARAKVMPTSDARYADGLVQSETALVARVDGLSAADAAALLEDLAQRQPEAASDLAAELQERLHKPKLARDLLVALERRGYTTENVMCNLAEVEFLVEAPPERVFELANRCVSRAGVNTSAAVAARVYAYLSMLMRGTRDDEDTREELIRTITAWGPRPVVWNFDASIAIVKRWPGPAARLAERLLGKLRTGFTEARKPDGLSPEQLDSLRKSLFEL